MGRLERRRLTTSINTLYNGTSTKAQYLTPAERSSPQERVGAAFVVALESALAKWRLVIAPCFLGFSVSRILGSCTLRGVARSLERALPGRLGKMRPIDLSSVPDEARRMHASSNFKYPLFSSSRRLPQSKYSNHVSLRQPYSS